MTKTRGQKSPAPKPAPEKKTKVPKAAPAPKKTVAAKPKESSVKGKSPPKEVKVRRMHPEAVKRRDARVKAKVGQQIDVPLVAREIPKDTYTVVYAGSVMFLDNKKARHKLQRGETIQLTSAGYKGCGSVLGRALVKGNLSMNEVHALLKASQGQVPGTAGFGKAPLEAIDFASALPVKDQESQATSASLSLPNFVPMETKDIQSWAASQSWLGDETLEGLEKKHEIVAAIKDRAAVVEADSKSKPAFPEGDFQDV